MIEVICDSAKEILFMRTIMDAGILNVSPEYYTKLMNECGLKRSYDVQYKKSDNYVNDIKPKEDRGMSNVKHDVFQYLKEIIHPLFTQNYTKVYATAEKTYNAHHHYIVADAESGEEIQKIHFQEGPIKECGVNGVANEDMILMVINRLGSFQESEFACEENAEAIEHLEAAINALRRRTNKRKDRGVEGTSKV